jgi:hypothetical protein
MASPKSAWNHQQIQWRGRNWYVHLTRFTDVQLEPPMNNLSLSSTPATVRIDTLLG